MKPSSAEKAVLRCLRQAGRELTSLRPLDAIEAMLDFYAAERAEGCALEDDGDMLLYQWGTHDWGDGESFELDITRQFTVTGEEDDDTRQLSLRFKFKPSAELRELGDGNRWCHSPSKLQAFRTFI